ncbi:hypothetical protein CEUSTIGMA_g12106.t1 [Chlamydomonas eustigma]|uniref:Cytidyltransferase-like domain-containing protein n=1 Tax=Chlamydomonas eustigma TaxID=1157962 RepID=A0A250XNL6_9CHLO|nr:hypothetical protein CEUSTIGMA_g12106.t1 [Chlamydomonas eustigma]|eukprot:GAX84685.1 hypothetical protein CEUSTIGMA_g12106.t1 [Chlamydomonas eustigma]
MMEKPQRIVFVSGCYDILHGGHLAFFSQARSLGDYLVVSFAGDESLKAHKGGRSASIPTEHKKALLEALRMVDEVVIGADVEGQGALKGLDFYSHFMRIRPQILAVTEDDRYGDVKRDLCTKIGAQYVVLPKDLDYDKTSTTEILQSIRAPQNCPLRVDFGGGWLDVPKLSRSGAYIVNCAVTPLVTLQDWCYELGGGLGGSAAWALLQGRSSIESELDLGVGWQDPAVIQETGLCVWKSGERPDLEFKSSGSFLKGLMAIQWTGKSHITFEQTGKARNYDMISEAGSTARQAVLPEKQDVNLLASAIHQSYLSQLDEGMPEIVPSDSHPGELARKYCGGGWGGYVLFLFSDQTQRDAFITAPDSHYPSVHEASGKVTEQMKPQKIAIEPYVRPTH